jgi:serine protease Do
MNMHAFKPVFWFLILVMVVSLACSVTGGGSSPTATVGNVEEPTQAIESPTEEPTEAVVEEPTEAVVEEPTPEAQVETSGAISSLQDVKQAIIQIESQGTFIDPEFGLIQNGAGRGSGFIIDPEGIAVTNNHVVTGAALLKVWVGGEDSPRNARVLGVSECSDLAVIDIDGSGFPYLDWFGGSADVGMDIYVAGFPLGDPEYTLTRGVISKAQANGETSWASVDAVIEYDATTNPGNSGGPVVTPDGKVVGIHYAGSGSTRQAFGISQEIARNVIGQLREGRNIDTIGINGQAVGTEDGSLTGIWVSSVQSGSPADKAGIQPGDIITMIENLVLATDGSMADYCDILRSHRPEDTLSMQVLRWASYEVLEGQLNGRELETTYVWDGSSSTTDGSTEGSTDGGTTTGTVTDWNLAAVASGEYYYSTEFDFVEDPWYTFAVPDSDNYDATIDNSTLLIEVNDENSTVYALYDLEMELTPIDVRLDAAVETVGGPNRNNISLVCRATEDGWYEFSMNSGGYWYIWKYENDEYTMLAQGASNSINLQRASNEITATCIGTDLAFYVNGTEMGTVRDNRFKNGGQVGISVSTFDIPGADVEFDWFVASVP